VHQSNSMLCLVPDTTDSTLCCNMIDKQTGNSSTTEKNLQELERDGKRFEIHLHFRNFSEQMPKHENHFRFLHNETFSVPDPKSFTICDLHIHFILMVVTHSRLKFHRKWKKSPKKLDESNTAQLFLWSNQFTRKKIRNFIKLHFDIYIIPTFLRF
jgi:hypothetical protein